LGSLTLEEFKNLLDKKIISKEVWLNITLRTIV
jgi:uncharacterized protein YqgQ